MFSSKHINFFYYSEINQVYDFWREKMFSISRIIFIERMNLNIDNRQPLHVFSSELNHNSEFFTFYIIVINLT